MTEPSLSDIERRIEEVRSDIKDLRGSFVPMGLWEDWRRDNYGRRIESVERDLQRLTDRFDKLIEETNARFRSVVMLAISGLVLPVAVGMILIIVRSQAG